MPERWLEFAGAVTTPVWVTVAVVLVYGLVDRLSRIRVTRGAGNSGLRDDSRRIALRTMRLITGIVAAAALAIVWGVDVYGLIVLATSILTITGVALFASWSLLSNVTAYFVLLFRPSFRRGNFVRVLDLDNYVEGYIADIGPFSTRLITESRETVTYPNNLLLGRPVMINPRERWSGLGKVPAGGPEGGRQGEGQAPATGPVRPEAVSLGGGSSGPGATGG